MPSGVRSRASHATVAAQGATVKRISLGQEGLGARGQHLKGEDLLRHATVQSVGPKDRIEDDLAADRHPEDK